MTAIRFGTVQAGSKRAKDRMAHFKITEVILCRLETLQPLSRHKKNL